MNTWAGVATRKHKQGEEQTIKPSVDRLPITRTMTALQ